MLHPRSILFYLFAFTALLFTGCKKEQKVTNIICYIDFSETPDWETRMANMESIVEKNIIYKLPFNSRLVVLPLDKGSLTSGKELLLATVGDEFDFIPDMTPTADEEKVSTEKLKQLKDSLAVTFRAVFEVTKNERKAGQLQKGTDIFGAISQAGRYLGKNNNVLLFLSDMMNRTPSFKMEKGSFSEGQIVDALKKAPSATLANTSILVYTGSLTNMDAAHYKTVQIFWEKYFSQNNLPLIDYTSGSVSAIEKTVSGN